jgi:hypothetical protein
MINEKVIYNAFLKVSRSKQSLPYRLRKHWEGFEESVAYPYTVKLKNLFTRNKHIDVFDFLNAPYTIYPGESGFDLSFYTSQKAIKIYSMYMKKQLTQSPDSEYHLNHILKGLKFIKKFCLIKNINMEEYINFKESTQYSFIIHLKRRFISIYNLFAFKGFELAFKNCDPDITRFTIGDMYDQIPVFRTKFLNSNSAKSLAFSGLDKIKENKNNS